MDLLEHISVLPVLGTPQLDAALQVESHQTGEEGQNHPPLTFWSHCFWCYQDMIGFLDCKCTWPGHVQALIHQHPQALSELLSVVHPLACVDTRVAPAQVQNLAISFVKPHEILLGPALNIQVEMSS